MDRKSEETSAQKRTRSTNLASLRAVVAAYLVYLGGSLIVDHLRGRSEMPAVLAWVAGLVFIAAGFGFGYFIWKQWKAEAAAAAPAEDAGEESTPEA